MSIELIKKQMAMKEHASKNTLSLESRILNVSSKVFSFKMDTLYLNFIFSRKASKCIFRFIQSVFYRAHKYTYFCFIGGVHSAQIYG
jgi:hypothetical protein